MLSRHPLPTADVVIELPDRRIVLIRRRNPPVGWALPGGFIESGETAEDTALREALEETGLRVELVELFHVYSDPRRDPRQHTLTVVFLARAQGEPIGGDDAAEARAFTEEAFPADLAFDHSRILADYLRYRRTGMRPKPGPTTRPALSPSQRTTLLRIARGAIRARLAGEDIPPMELTGELAEPGSAFVSLHFAGQLRGCIGTLARERPLYRVVHDMALAAAFEDPRFPPLRHEEFSDLEVHISVLSAPQPTSAIQVVPGLHGVSVSCGRQRAVYLPQVAIEEGWDREMLLRQTCLKAGLDPEAWRDSATEILSFTAEVFGQRSTPGG